MCQVRVQVFQNVTNKRKTILLSFLSDGDRVLVKREVSFVFLYQVFTAPHQPTPQPTPPSDPSLT